MNVFHKNMIVETSDIPEIAETYKIPFSVAENVIDQMKRTGSVAISAFSGPTRVRVKALEQVLDTDPPEAPQDAPQEPTEVLYDSNEDEARAFYESPAGNLMTSVFEEAVEETDEFDPEETTERDEIVDHAAHGLMEAFSDSEGCFIISDDGCCRINPDKPPSVQHSLTVVANVLKLKDLGSVVDDKSSWMLGSIISSLEDFHGENFSVSQVCDSTTKAYNTVVTAVGVFKAFKLKRYKLSFSSHKEAHYAKIPDAHKRLILHKAETYKIGPKSIRALCSIAKTMEDDTTIRNIRSQKQALDLIAAYKEAKVVYVVYDEGEWTRVTGLAGEPPEGKIVLNLKDWTAQAGNQIVQIQKRHTPQP